MQRFLLCLLGLLFFQAALAQKLDHVLGEILVKPVSVLDIQQWTARWQTFEGTKTQLQIKERVSEPLNIWTLRFDYTQVDENRLLAAIRLDPAVEMAQFNHLLELRSTIPNDPQFNMQWQYINTGQTGGTPGADLDMELAWDVTTGGLTVEGDTIVICVIDDGIDLAHEDLAKNIWLNFAEIPGNGIDDDQNGFMDDYRGWNTGTNNDNIDNRRRHGTAVTSIIGAKGNNGIGVSGINWNVKVMFVLGGTGVESEVLEAYSYPLVMRKKYNATGGQQGAFVVATNSSWGIERKFPSDAPLWCAMYDSLGVHGILNAGATANKNINVDQEGDLPTSCTSDFLISVTNIDKNNTKVNLAGFGLQSIDLGAFGGATGEGIWTAVAPNTYGEFSGTSAATPQVAGAVGLLYAASCPGFIALAKNDPAFAALFAKQCILDGVVPNSSLANITSTNGRLNINNSLRLLLERCSDCFPPSNLKANNIADKSAQITWNAVPTTSRVDLRWRVRGANVWVEIQNVSKPYSFNNLLACTEYELQIKGYCEGEVFDWSESLVFKTDGCCIPPADFKMQLINVNNAFATWSKVLAAQKYAIIIRPEDAPNWDTLDVNGTATPFLNLSACTKYELKISSICMEGASDFSESFFFKTKGCGACQDIAYCRPSGLKGFEEWVKLVKLNTLENTSGSNGGYADFTEFSATQLARSGMYDVSLQPGFLGQVFTEYFTVWIDYDQDGVFENQEKIVDRSVSGGTLINDRVTIPSNAPLGSTRMRVAMQFLAPGGPCSFDSGFDGEVEDYCVEIVMATPTEAITAERTRMRVFPNPFSQNIQLALDIEARAAQANVQLINTLGQVVVQLDLAQVLPGTQTITIDTKELAPGLYFLRYQDQNQVQLIEKVLKKGQ